MFYEEVKEMSGAVRGLFAQLLRRAESMILSCSKKANAGCIQG